MDFIGWGTGLASVLCLLLPFVLFSIIRARKVRASNSTKFISSCEAEPPNAESECRDCSCKSATGAKSEKLLDASGQTKHKVLILYASQTGTTELIARSIHRGVPQSTLLECSSFEIDQMENVNNVIFCVPTYTDGKPPESAVPFFHILSDFVSDFRVPADAWSHLRFAVVGIGSRAYGDTFNAFALQLHSWMLQRSAQKLLSDPILLECETAAFQISSHIPALRSALLGIQPAATVVEALSDGDEDEDGNEEDIEDMTQGPNRPNEMLNPRLRASLTKQGYSLFGTHSGVKLCRWTKSMIRGRGGCYKHTFYGISSLSCMEMTPSLACANKCVFCWRHHTNPTTREWRWTHESPDFILQSALEKHGNMIKTLRGVPGVTQQTIEAAMKVRHCALSLVGEPILYPEINALLNLMHANHISSFLVTNAQFPDQMRTLSPVTQLYVSVDAGNAKSLKAIDRPIFEDFWERYLECLKLIRDKKQRTVFRLTLVNSYNMEEINDYVGLIRLGSPDFVEVKGVTYCGDSGTNGLTMKNVPYHEEVLSFCKKITEQVSETYTIACEHAHSCCVLIAKKKFYINETWHTWIDYEKFYKLVESNTSFTSLDYAAPTPEWAIYGSSSLGFDPEQQHFQRKKKAAPVS